jgi:hypothetical protein
VDFSDYLTDGEKAQEITFGDINPRFEPLTKRQFT